MPLASPYPPPHTPPLPAYTHAYPPFSPHHLLPASPHASHAQALCLLGLLGVHVPSVDTVVQSGGRSSLITRCPSPSPRLKQVWRRTSTTTYPYYTWRHECYKDSTLANQTKVVLAFTLTNLLAAPSTCPQPAFQFQKSFCSTSAHPIPSWPLPSIITKVMLHVKLALCLYLTYKTDQMTP